MKHESQSLKKLMIPEPLVPSADLLPSEPLDGFTLTLWSAEPSFPDGARMYRWVYRANATWRDVFPEDKGREGVPFHDEWMVYMGEQFTGRIDGWARIREFLPKQRFFASQASAQRASVLWLLVRAAELRQERVAALRQFDTVLEKIPTAEWPECPECDGSGDVMERLTCPSCRGNGRLVPRIGDS